MLRRDDHTGSKASTVPVYQSQSTDHFGCYGLGPRSVCATPTGTGVAMLEKYTRTSVLFTYSDASGIVIDLDLSIQVDEFGRLQIFERTS